jgi:hypothetical protein
MTTRFTLTLLAALYAMVLTGQEYQELPLRDLSAFRPNAGNWQIVGQVQAVLDQDQVLKTEKGSGVLVNLPTAKQQSELFTLLEHGDLDLELEFMMARRSNSGIYLQGRYEVQLLDSWGKRHPTFGDCGGIYERWDDRKQEGQQGFEGYAPRLNASRAPGLWQKMEISFMAPRFDQQGKKTANARILYLRLNGYAIHENLELTGPTRGGGAQESPLGPLRIQGDHGPVAFRNIRYRTFGNPPLVLDQLRYEHYFTEKDVTEPQGLERQSAGPASQLTHEVINLNEKFLLRFQGELEIKIPGRYYFDLNAFGWGQLLIGGKPVLERGPWERRGSIELPAGRHALDLRYTKTGSWFANGLGLFVSGPGLRQQALHAESSLPPSRDVSNPILAGFQAEPVVLRSFMDFQAWNDSVAHRITHPVSVGFSQGVSYSYNLGNGALFQAWRGGFLDATPMWNDRGDGSSRPIGSLLALNDGPALAVLATEQAPWTAVLPAEAGYRSRGYRLDGEGRPIFEYELYGLRVTDEINALDDGRRLERRLQVQGTAPLGLYCRLAAGREIIRLPNNTYSIDGRYYIQLPAKGGARVALRTVGQWQELIAPLDVASQLSYQIAW